MAWHIFEKLLEEVANQSPFIGKIWITSLFMFRLIVVASIGDTVYSDEQSAFQCNTLQPGCANVCFNHFSPISQIRFWAVQILFIGTPSIVYIIYALPKLKKEPPTTQKKDNKEKMKDQKESNDMKVLEDLRENQTQKTFSTDKSHCPPYDEAIIGKNGKISALSCKLRHRYDDDLYVNTNGYRNICDKVLELEEPNAPLKDSEIKECGKKVEEVNHVNINKPDVKSTPGLWRAYLIHVITRMGVEAAFLYLQYDLYKFDVEELYICEGFPCPRVVECFVSRPREKTLFLRFMYLVSGLSLLLNVIEVIYLIVVWMKKYSCRNKRHDCMNDFSSNSTVSDPFTPGASAPRSPFDHSMRTPHTNTYPMLRPFPRTHTNSFGNSSDGTIDSDYRFYDI